MQPEFNHSDASLPLCTVPRLVASFSQFPILLHHRFRAALTLSRGILWPQTLLPTSLCSLGPICCHFSPEISLSADNQSNDMPLSFLQVSGPIAGVTLTLVSLSRSYSKLQTPSCCFPTAALFAYLSRILHIYMCVS